MWSLGFGGWLASHDSTTVRNSGCASAQTSCSLDSTRPSSTRGPVRIPDLDKRRDTREGLSFRDHPVARALQRRPTLPDRFKYAHVSRVNSVPPQKRARNLSRYRLAPMLSPQVSIGEQPVQTPPPARARLRATQVPCLAIHNLFGDAGGIAADDGRPRGPWIRSTMQPNGSGSTDGATDTSTAANTGRTSRMSPVKITWSPNTKLRWRARESDRGDPRCRGRHVPTIR